VISSLWRGGGVKAFASFFTNRYTNLRHMKSYTTTAYVTLRLTKEVTASDVDEADASVREELEALKSQIADGSPFTVEYFEADDIEVVGGDDEPEDDRDRDERRGYYD
jgi:hypothetical protein